MTIRTFRDPLPPMRPLGSTAAGIAEPPARYTRTAIALHWLMAAGLVGTFCVGLYMADLKMSPFRLKLFSWHKWAGITILLLAALRLVWRMTHRPPPEVPMPAWQARLANAVHRGLYLLFFVVPLLGWTYSSAAGFPVVLFGVLPLPNLVEKNKELAHTLDTLHATFAWVLAVGVVLHVAAALKHHFFDHDRLLRRMWPGRAGR